jgi:hypothetical protein
MVNLGGDAMPKILRVPFKCWVDGVSVTEKINNFLRALLASRKECSNSVSISPSLWTDGQTVKSEAVDRRTLPDQQVSGQTIWNEVGRQERTAQVDGCQRQYNFRIRLDQGCTTLVLGRIFVYTSYSPHLGVAVTIAAETPRKRRG